MIAAAHANAEVSRAVTARNRAYGRALVISHEKKLLGRSRLYRHALIAAITAWREAMSELYAAQRRQVRWHHASMRVARRRFG